MSHLSKLLQNPQLWRSGRRDNGFRLPAISSGHTPLDRALHSDGWPLAGSSELLCDDRGIGEISLLMPALAKLSQQQAIAWLNPPFQPYAPALVQAGIKLESCLFVCPQTPRDQLWAAEELLRAAAFGAVIHCSGSQRLADRDLRRLQLAAREQHCWHIHLRDLSTAAQSSPAPLRLTVASTPSQLQIHVLKQAGGPAGQKVSVPRDARLLHEQQPVTQWPQPNPQHGKKSRFLLAHPLPAKPRQGLELH